MLGELTAFWASFLILGDVIAAGALGIAQFYVHITLQNIWRLTLHKMLRCSGGGDVTFQSTELGGLAIGRPSRAKLSDNATSSIPAKPAAKPATKRTVSAEARAKMAAAQKARWAKVNKTAKKSAPNVPAAPAVKSAAPNGTVPKTAPAKKAISAKKVVRAKTKTPVTPAS